MAGLNSKQTLLTIKAGRPGNDLHKETVVPTCLKDFKDLADNSPGLFNCSPQKVRDKLMALKLPFILDSKRETLSLPLYDIFYI